MSTAAQPSDIRRSDLAVAVATAVGVFIASLIALKHAQLEHESELPSIDPGLGIPIAVRPVSEGSLVGSGSSSSEGDDDAPIAWRRKRRRAAVPRTWLPSAEPEPRRPTPKKADSKTLAPVASDPAPVEPELPDVTQEPPDAAPSADTPDEAQTQTQLDESAEPEAAEPEAAEPDAAEPDAAEPDAAEPEAAEPDATEPDATEPDAAASDTAQQDTAAPEGDTAGESQGETSEAGEDGGAGGTDPLLERAIAFYRARLVAWFSARFRVTGSGLSSEELGKYRVRVHIELGDDLRIDDYRILSSDHPVFEKAARAMLDKLRGEKLPPPPENYPGAVQRQLTVTFTCAEDTCD